MKFTNHSSVEEERKQHTHAPSECSQDPHFPGTQEPLGLRAEKGGSLQGLECVVGGNHVICILQLESHPRHVFARTDIQPFPISAARERVTCLDNVN